MGAPSYARYNGEPILSHLQSEVPKPDEPNSSNEFFVFIMGPYTAFNAEFAYDDGDQLSSPFIDDPLFDSDRHVTDNGHGDFNMALADLREDLRSELGVRAFIATDVNIPTIKQVEENDLDEPGMAVLDQSVAFAAVSNAVLFVYSASGLNAGPGVEAGAILGEFHLRHDNPLNEMKPRKRIKIFRGPRFKSASFEEIPSSYGVGCVDYASRESLMSQIRHFLVDIERTSREREFPIFIPFDPA